MYNLGSTYLSSEIEGDFISVSDEDEEVSAYDDTFSYAHQSFRNSLIVSNGLIQTYDAPSADSRIIAGSSASMLSSTTHNTAPDIQLLKYEVNLSEGNSVKLSSIFTASDPDGDTLTYIIRDLFGDTSQGNSSYLLVDGVEYSHNVNVELTQAQYSRAMIIGGSLNAPNSFDVKVYDGDFYSRYETFTVNSSGSDSGGSGGSGGSGDGGGNGGGNTNHAPVVTSQSTYLDAGDKVALSSLVSASDADGDTLYYYVKDNSIGVNSSYLELDGSALSAGIEHRLTAEQFLRAKVVAGSDEATDSFSVRAYDGMAYSNLSTFNVTSDAPELDNHAPTLTTQHVTLSTGEAIHVSQLAQASDLDGDALTYTVLDLNNRSTSGYLELDGNKLNALETHEFTQAEFNRLKLVGGTGPDVDNISINVSDGDLASGYRSINFTSEPTPEPNKAPSLTTQEVTLQAGEVINVSQIAQASDPDGDALTYSVVDYSTGGESGYFQLNGNKLAQGIVHNLSQAEFDNLKLVGASGNDFDHMAIQVSDGEFTSGYEQIYLTTDAPEQHVNNVPILGVRDITLDARESISLFNLVEAYDPDGDALTYTVRDSSGLSRSGYLELDGVPLQQQQYHTFTQSEFARVRLVGADSSHQESIAVSVSDGTSSSGYQYITMTTEVVEDHNTAPILSVQSDTVEVGQSVLLAPLVSAFDSDGDTLTYFVKDNSYSSTSSYIELDGVKLAAGTEHQFTQAEFKRARLVGGSKGGEDSFSVRVHDGTEYSGTGVIEFITAAPEVPEAVNNPPTLTVDDVTLDAHESILLSSLVHADDLDGNALTYTVYESNSSAYSGYLELDGQALPARQTHTLSAQEFARVRLVGAESGHTEDILISVSDGVLSSDYETLRFTTEQQEPVHHAPTLNVSDATVDAEASILLSSLVQAHDLDGDALTYLIKDNSNGSLSSYIEVNGQKLSSGLEHQLTPAQFANAKLVGASVAGDGSFSIRVYDGSEYSSAATINLTTNAPVIEENTRPDIDVDNITLETGESIFLSEVAKPFDIDGDALTYQIGDFNNANKTGTSGYLELDGQKVVEGKYHTFTQAEFNRLKLVGGEENGLDQIYMRAHDGTEYSLYRIVKLTSEIIEPPNTAPELSVENGSIEIGGEVLLSTLVDGYDADGDALSYLVKDNSASNASSYLELDGQKLSAGIYHEFTQEELGRVKLIGGSIEGEANFSVQISDGEDTSDLGTIQLTTFTPEPVNTAPTLEVDGITLDPGESALLSDLVEAHDAEGDALTYVVRDLQKGDHTGYLELDGQKIVTGSYYYLTPEEFARVRLIGADDVYSEDIYINVTDGVLSSGFKTLSLNTNPKPPAAPEISVEDGVVDAGGSVLLSTLISASGDTFTYHISDETLLNPGVDDLTAYIRLDGQRLSARDNHQLSHEEFMRAELVGGAEEAFNGFLIHVSDGDQVSSTERFYLKTNAPIIENIAPEILVDDVSLLVGEEIELSQIIHASDADQDALEYYIRDNNTVANSGYIILDGVRLAADERFVTLTHEELSRAKLVAGEVEGFDNITIQVSDGTDTSELQTLTLTTKAPEEELPEPNPDTIFGTEGHDLIEGTEADDSIDGLGGNDRLYGGEGNDTIEGGAGGDRIYGGEGHDTLSGSEGRDKIEGGAGDDNIFGGDDADVLYGGDGDDWIEGGAGDDYIVDGDGDDMIYGGDGNDRIILEHGFNYVEGGAGNDAITSLYGDDYIVGGAGLDTFIFGRSSNTPMSREVTIEDFSATEGDVLNIHGLLADVDDLQASIHDYVEATQTTDGTLLEVTSSNNEVTTIKLIGVDHFDLDDMISDSSVII